MECSKAEELICRAVDGALPDAERTELEKHVHECAPCAELRDDLGRQDRELRAAFEAPRAMAASVAEKTIAALRGVAPRRRSWTPFLVPLAAAAGFLVAFLAFPREVVREVVVKEPYAGAQHVDPVKQPTGKVMLMMGRAEIRPAEAATWAFCRDADSFEMGAVVRCADDTLAEIETSEGSRVCLNRGTEVQFIANRNLKLLRGQILCSIAPSHSGIPYRVTTLDGTITADAATIDVLFVPEQEGKKFVESTATILTVLDGAAKLHNVHLAAGQRITSFGGT